MSDEQFAFVQQLARDLAAGEISLPSFPAVVLKIRNLLQDEKCDIAEVSRIVSTDAVLVSRLFVFANSALHNRLGKSVTTLETAISRLGLDVVRNTALSLAIKQIVLAQEHKAIVPYLKAIWAKSMRLASMGHAVAGMNDDVDDETAFMCGLLHEIGMVYILTKARDFPGFLGDQQSLTSVMAEWHPQVGRSIVESWDFPEHVVQSLDPKEFLDEHTHHPAAPVDVIYLAGLLLDKDAASWPELVTLPACQKLNATPEKMARIRATYREKLATMQQSLA